MPLDQAIATRRGPRDSRDLADALLRAVSSPGPWQGYRSAVLPPLPPPSSMFWSDAELVALQHDEAISAARAARRTHRASAGDERSQWALAMVCSRSFCLGDESGRRLRALLPFFDLFNHLPESPAEYAAAAPASGEDEPPSPWTIEEGAVVLRAAQPAKQGEEVLLPYGVETSAELLATHGFAMSDNSADYVRRPSMSSSGSSSSPSFAHYSPTAPALPLVPRCRSPNSPSRPQPFRAPRRQLPLFASFDELLAALAPAAARAGRRRAIWRGSDAAAAPLAARPGALAASAHVFGAAQLALCDEAALGSFEEVYASSAGHYVLAPAATQIVGSGQTCGAPALEAASRRALGDAARARLAPLLRVTSLEQDERAEARLRAELVQGAPGAMPAARRGRMERALAAVQYRAGVKRFLAGFASRCALEDG